jgi:hypothetical protein
VASTYIATSGLHRSHGSICWARGRKTSGGATTIAIFEIGFIINTGKTKETPTRAKKRWTTHIASGDGKEVPSEIPKAIDASKEERTPRMIQTRRRILSKKQRSFCQENPAICIAVPIIISIPIIIGAPELLPLIPVVVP